MPSEKLIEGGVVNKPLKYYGNKLRKKIEEHGFNQTELKNLPIAIANPIAVFNNYRNDSNRSILTELKMQDGNVLVAVSVGDGVDIDFNIIRSTFGKSSNKIENWIKQGLFTYIDKKKILNYLYPSAPIAEIANNSESFSGRKGTTNSRTDQTNSGENSENLQSGEDMRFNVEGDGEIEGIDLNEAYELSEEEAAQLIDEWSTEEVNGLIEKNGFDKNNQIV